MAGSVFIPLVSVFDGRGIRQAKTGMASLAQSVKSLKAASVGAAASFASVGAVNFLAQSTTAARDLERNMYGLEAVFEGLTPTMEAFAKGAGAIGLSQSEAAKASTFLGSVLKQSGFEMGIVAGETQNLVGLAADLSATYGYDLSEALSGMTALFRGEYDPIEKFGVAMKQSEVNALLAERGLNKLTGAAQRQAMAQARLDILYQRSQDAQGAYAKQAGTLYTVQTQLKASTDNLKAALGSAVTGPFAAFANSMLPVIDKMEGSLIPLFKTLGAVAAEAAPAIAAKAMNFLVLLDAINPLIEALAKLVTPLLKPLAVIFDVLTKIITPFIPLITFLAKVIQAVLTPAVFFLTFIFTLAGKVIGSLIEGFTRLASSIPGVGGAFESITKNLDDFISEFDVLLGSTTDTSNAYDEFVKKYSKDIKSNPIDTVASATDKAAKGIQQATEKLNKFIEDATNIQKSIIDSANITGLLDKTSDEITQSIVYLDGKFKTVAFSASNGASNLADAFKANLDKIKVFYRNLQALSKAGLDPELIQQIVGAGADAGNATAEAILASGKEGVTGLNKTFKGIKKVAGDIGYTAAKAMKSAGTRVGNGLIDGLLAQQDRLVASAAEIGNAVGNAMGDAVTQSYAEKIKLIQTPKTDKGKAPFYLSPSTAPAGLPSVATMDMPRFISSFSAGTPGAGLAGAFRLMESEDIANPFNNESEAMAFARFNENRLKANEYNISINVAPGASPAQVGDAFVKAIQEYERTRGKGWRTN
jgi:methyl-accepting chemotaxis protein